MLITVDHWAWDICPNAIVYKSNINEIYIEFKVFIQGFLSLNAHNFLYCVSYVKVLVILPKIVSFNLSVIHAVLNNIVHQLRWILLDLFAFTNFVKDFKAALEPRSLLSCFVELVQQTYHFLVKCRFLYVFSDYWVQGIPQLMWHNGVDQRRELALSLDLHVLNLSCYVHKRHNFHSLALLEEGF